MYAVAGTWHMDPEMRKEQGAALQTIVAGVRQLPGFVRGFWSRDVDEPDLSLTYILFETLEQAEEFRRAVEANAPAQAESGVGRTGLRIAEVEADA
ncbi:MAG TPA: antibiotic biosynthesis monooxygenase [Mycobacteriales bacterium]|nr:antibiotic biosynthesis monooxygenase [Mycobacteriales bacterium]